MWYSSPFAKLISNFCSVTMKSNDVFLNVITLFVVIFCQIGILIVIETVCLVIYSTHLNIFP